MTDKKPEAKVYEVKSKEQWLRLINNKKLEKARERLLKAASKLRW